MYNLSDRSDIGYVEGYKGFMDKKQRLDNKYENFLRVPLYLIAAFVIMTICLFLINIAAGLVACAFTIAYTLVMVSCYIRYRASINTAYIDFAMEHGKVQKELLKEFPVPYALLDRSNKFVWVNDEFSRITELSKRRLMRMTAGQIFEGSTFDLMEEDKDVLHSDIEYNDREYKMEVRRVTVNRQEENESGDIYTAVYLFDVTELNRVVRDYNDEKLVSGLIYIDNYDEVLDGLEEVRHSLLMALVDRKISKYMASVDAIVKSFEKDKYLFSMPQKYLGQLQENKFAILDEVKAINIGNDLPLTLSISLGTDQGSFIQNFEAARAAMELALGRGGDQVVLKAGEKITYYGGKSQGTEKSTRVKARVKTLAFRELLENKEKVIIMAHKDPDMDAFGSAIGVYRMVTSMSKEAHIVINEVSSAISPIFGNFTSNSIYGRDMIIDSEQALEMINADTMLVIVDVNRPSYTECEELISLAKTVVVFDHHRQTKEVVSNATLSYIEPFASSACEMIAEMLQYMDEKIKLRPSEADAMYAGILIDTDNFLTKTGVRTFEAAAFLKRSGADVMRVRKMFRSGIDTYRQRADGVRNAELIQGAFAVSIFEPKEGGEESPVVLTAKVANELLNIAGVRASFVLTQMDDDVRISARAIDDVNVQVIMEALGGGGHANIAGAQLKNVTTEEAKAQLVSLLSDMYKKGDI